MALKHALAWMLSVFRHFSCWFGSAGNQKMKLPFTGKGDDDSDASTNESADDEEPQVGFPQEEEEEFLGIPLFLQKHRNSLEKERKGSNARKIPTGTEELIDKISSKFLCFPQNFEHVTHSATSMQDRFNRPKIQLQLHC